MPCLNQHQSDLREAWFVKEMSNYFDSKNFTSFICKIENKFVNCFLHCRTNDEPNRDCSRLHIYGIKFFWAATSIEYAEIGNG